MTHTAKEPPVASLADAVDLPLKAPVLPAAVLHFARQFAQRLLELKNDGAQISLVQIYSATRPTARSVCSHLPLRTLSRIAQTVRQATGLKAEVF